MNHNLTPPIAATAPALALVASMAAKHPTLPAPYLVLSTHDRSVTVGVQCPTLDAFEAWREALDIDPDDVTLFASMINVDAQPVEVSGQKVHMHLYAGGLPALSERPTVELAPLDDDGPSDCIAIPDDWRARCQPEDSHDGPLHHDYALGRDLPITPQQVTGRCPHGIPDCICGGAR